MQRSDQSRFSWLPGGQLKLGRHWTQCSHELGLLLGSGVPLLDALETLVQQYRGRFGMILAQVRDRVAGGSSLAGALAEWPSVFDETSIRLVEVGESAGNLESVLQQLAAYRQRLAKLGDKVLTALMYPAFLVLFGLLSTVFLMTFVLPPLLENLKETVPELPWPTRVAKAVSDLMVQQGLWIFLLLVVIAVVAYWAARQPALRRRLDDWSLRLPLVGPMLVKQSISRLAMIVSVLTKSGLPLPIAVELAAKSTGNSVLREALQRCHQQMVVGKDFSETLAQYKLFPPLAVRVFAVGSESGKLDELLLKLSQDYNDQLDISSARITALIEPVLILVLALFVGFLLLATVLPILQASNLQGV
jgi:type II secretory pathway component PulF